jgi:hypothetical protein
VNVKVGDSDFQVHRKFARQETGGRRRRYQQAELQAAQQGATIGETYELPGIAAAAKKREHNRRRYCPQGLVPKPSSTSMDRREILGRISPATDMLLIWYQSSGLITSYCWA